MAVRVEQQTLGLPSIQRVVTPDRLLLFLKALPAQPGASIDPAKFVFGGRPYILKVFGSNPHGGPIRTLTHELPSIIPPGKIAIEITYQTNLNQFWQEVKRLEGKRKPAPISA
jgi:hypothetical protein